MSVSCVRCNPFKGGDAQGVRFDGGPLAFLSRPPVGGLVGGQRVVVAAGVQIHYSSLPGGENEREGTLGHARLGSHKDQQC